MVVADTHGSRLEFDRAKRMVHPAPVPRYRAAIPRGKVRVGGLDVRAGLIEGISPAHRAAVGLGSAGEVVARRNGCESLIRVGHVPARHLSSGVFAPAGDFASGVEDAGMSQPHVYLLQGERRTRCRVDADFIYTGGIYP